MKFFVEIFRVVAITQQCDSIYNTRLCNTTVKITQQQTDKR